ncbi:cathepsin L [Trichonephila clavipes]|nr:cathepsin L [Trichonephila clavipes]
MNVYNKSYTSAEEDRRRLVWEERVISIVHHNLRADAGLHSFRRGLNKYSDLTHAEYMDTLNGFKARNHFFEPFLPCFPSPMSTFPDKWTGDTMDWSRL